MPIKGQSPKETVHTEMHKFKHGELHSGSKHGPLVKNRKQAIAIALSEARKAAKRATGGKTKKGNVPLPKERPFADEDVIDKKFVGLNSGNIDDRRDNPHGVWPTEPSFSPDPSATQSNLANDLGAQTLAATPEPFFSRWMGQYDDPMSVEHTHDLYNNLYTPLADKAAKMRGNQTFADGGDVDNVDDASQLSERDQAAMMPETYQNPIAKGIVGGTIDEAIKSVMTPGQIMTPNPYPPGSEEAYAFEDMRYKTSQDWAFRKAMNMTLGAGQFPGEAGQLRTGIGITSKGPHLSQLDRFNQFEKAGMRPQENFQRTGWYRGDDGAPRFWVSDEGARLKTENIPTYDGKYFIPDFPLEASSKTTLGDIWEHPKLYEAYPWLKDVEVKPYFHPNPEAQLRGQYHPVTEAIELAESDNPQELHNVLHHEVIHAIQHHEGFANGANLKMYLPQDYDSRIKQMQDHAVQLAQKLSQAGVPLNRSYSASELLHITSANPEQLNPEQVMFRINLRQSGSLPLAYKLAQMGSKIEKDKTRAFQKYIHNSGESEARDAPFIRENPGSVKQWQIPVNKNPELIHDTIPGSPILPRRSSSYGAEAELPDDFIPDGVFENRKAKGGKVKHKQIDEDPQDHEFIDFSRGGLIDSHVPGRTDKIPMRVRPGSYVLPADIPSALGEGNSKAGAEILKKMFTHSAYGLPPPNMHTHEFRYPHSILHRHARGGKVAAQKVLPKDHQLGMRVPRGGSMCANCKYLTTPKTCGNEGFIKWNDGPDLPHASNEYCCDLYESKEAIKKADGGSTDTTPIIAAGGEFIVHPDVVKAVGHGDMKKGHKILDKFVLNTRKEHIDTLKKLKPPK